MQWLVDLVLEYLRINGLAVNRGDPADFDFTLADFTADGAYHDLDLSNILPEHVNIAYASLLIQATTIGRTAIFRTKGHTNFYNISRASTQVANQILSLDIQLFPDADRMISYRIVAALDTRCDLTIKGWDF